MSKSGLAAFGDDWLGIDTEILESYKRMSQVLSQSIVPPDLVEKLSASAGLTSSVAPLAESLAASHAKALEPLYEQLSASLSASHAEAIEPLYEQLSANLSLVTAAQRRMMEELSSGAIGAALKPLGHLRPWFEELVEEHRELVDDLEGDEAELAEEAGSVIERRLAQLEELAASGQEGLAQLVEAVVAYRLALLWIVQAKLVALMLVTMAVPGTDPLIVKLLGAAAAATQLLDRLLSGFEIKDTPDSGEEE